MRLSHCESYCAAPFCHIPCLPKSKDAPGGADALSKAPCPVARAVAVAAEDKPPPVQKIEVEPPEKVDGDRNDEKTLAAAVVVAPPKSNLKKANCDADGVCAPKGNVKWLDLLGKDLTEVKEFEPSLPRRPPGLNAAATGTLPPRRPHHATPPRHQPTLVPLDHIPGLTGRRCRSMVS